MGTVSGATRLADFFLQFRCWEFSPWIFSPGSRQPCWAWYSPTVGQLDTNPYGQCVSNAWVTLGWQRFAIWALEVFCSYCKCVVFFFWILCTRSVLRWLHRASPVIRANSEGTSSWFHTSVFSLPGGTHQPTLWRGKDLPSQLANRKALPFFFFWPSCMARGIWFPWPGIEPARIIYIFEIKERELLNILLSPVWVWFVIGIKQW